MCALRTGRALSGLRTPCNGLGTSAAAWPARGHLAHTSSTGTAGFVEKTPTQRQDGHCDPHRDSPIFAASRAS